MYKIAKALSYKSRLIDIQLSLEKENAKKRIYYYSNK